ncbi:MAG TPA: hypothetical protein VHT73_06385 [Thermodesulfobacteriota bacterium]|nr:hypothetical protein [Thermodesulfobacteriota bacterium]
MEQATGTRDKHYNLISILYHDNLISILYHALQGAETYNEYIRDAEQSGDNELAKFFRDVQEQERQRAERAKKLLTQRMG